MLTASLPPSASPVTFSMQPRHFCRFQRLLGASGLNLRGGAQGGRAGADGPVFPPTPPSRPKGHGLACRPPWCPSPSYHPVPTSSPMPGKSLTLFQEARPISPVFSPPTHALYGKGCSQPHSTLLSYPFKHSARQGPPPGGGGACL